MEIDNTTRRKRTITSSLTQMVCRKVKVTDELHHHPHSKSLSKFFILIPLKAQSARVLPLTKQMNLDLVEFTNSRSARAHPSATANKSHHKNLVNDPASQHAQSSRSTHPETSSLQRLSCCIHHSLDSRNTQLLHRVDGP
jgi:hypothetical protein